MKLLSSICLIILCISPLVNLFAQDNTLEVKGIVVDASNMAPLPFANIFLKTNIMKGTVTNENGTFHLTIDKKYITDSLVISFVGFKENIISVSQIIGKSYEIYLSPKINNIIETTIKAKRVISEEFTIEKINQLDIYLNPLSKADPLLAVNGMASSTTTDESASISLRGSSPAETGIFFNEVPVYDAVRFQQLNGIGTFSIFNTSVVDKMLVFPSNPPIEYGNSTSGLVSIYTNDELPGKIISINLSLASIGAYMSGNINKKTGITVFSNYQPSAVFIGLNSESMRDLKSFNTIDLGVFLNYKINNKTSYKLFNYTNTEGFEINMRHPSYIGSFKQDKQRTFFVSNFIRNFSKGELSVNNGLSFSKECYIYGNTDLVMDKTDFYGAVSYLYFLNKISIKTGFSFDNRNQGINGEAPLHSYAIGPSHPSFEIALNDRAPVAEGFAYLKCNLTSKIIIGGGVRKNIPRANQKNYISYQLNLHYSINRKNSFNLSGGHYNKYNIPTNEINTVFLITNNQFSFDYKFVSDKIEFNTALFYKDAMINKKPENITGAEIFLKYYMSERFKSQLSYTFINAEKKEEKIFPSEYDLDYYIRGSLSYIMIGNINASAVIMLRQGTYYKPVEGREFDDITQTYIPLYAANGQLKRLPYYNKIDLSFSRIFTIGDSWNVIGFLGISNLINYNNVRSVEYNFDYSIPFNERYSKRTIYFGGVLNF